MTHVVVVGVDFDQTRQERARRQCMQRLFFELSRIGVSQAVLESRTESLNRADRRMFDALRGKGLMSGLRADFGLPTQEPMLWVPDAVAGAVGAKRFRGEPSPFNLMAESLRIIDVDLT